MNRKQRRADEKRNKPAVKGASSMQGLFGEALQHHQAGRLDEAERLCRQVLAIDPLNADSLHLLGILSCRTNDYDLAVQSIRQAIAINPLEALYHSNLGAVLKGQGRLDEAAACYRTAIDLRPDFPDAHNNLGAALAEQGRLDEAVACYRRALDLRPDYPDALNNLGAALKVRGRLDEAVACYRRALDLRPNYPDAQNNLAAALRRLERPGGAGGLRSGAIQLRPDLPEAQNNQGAALAGQGRLDEATACYRRAIHLKPDFPDAHNNLGAALAGQGRLDEAVCCYRRALDLRGNYPEAHNNLGAALEDLGQLDDAVACYRTAADTRPDYAEAHYNLGRASREQGRLDEAVAGCRRALELRPDFPEARCSLAMALLGRGEMAAGWQEYEWRWQMAHMLKERRNFVQPQWHGEAAEGRTLLIHAEQGFGDTLQFCRYAPLAAERGLRVILEVQKPLVRLLRSLPGVDMVVASGEQLPVFDLHCPMLSLPLAMGTILATIPDTTPYLHAEATQVATWRNHLAVQPRSEPRIGLVWAGNPRSHLPSAAAIDRRRSMPPDRLAPLFDLSGVHFFSLQKGGPTAPAQFPLIDLMGEMEDFAATASLVSNLDLIISVDTAVVHLAAALNKPVWMLDRFGPCWRWLTGRRDSPWYPTLRIYRQPQPDDWESVVAEVAGDLRSLAATQRTS